MRTRFHHRFQRLFQIALQNSSRNLLVSGATVLMMALILFILNVVGILNGLAHSSLEAIGQKVDLILYLQEDASFTEVSALMDDLKKNPRLLDVSYTSKEDALEAFLKTYPDQETPFEALDLENPLPASLNLKTKDPRDHEFIQAELETSPYKRLIVSNESHVENQNIVSRLIQLTTFTETLFLGVILSFAMGTLLLMMNAVHLSIFHRKTEIEIMKWVGADRSMILGPFMIEGALTATAASLLSLFFLLIFTGETGLLNLSTVSISSHPWLLLLVEWILAVGIGMGSSALATLLYLKNND